MHVLIRVEDNDFSKYLVVLLDFINKKDSMRIVIIRVIIFLTELTHEL